MKTIAVTLSLAAVLGLAAPAHSAGAEKAKTATVTGEVVDLGCYLGHAAVGAKHASCATKCINAGMPMGLLTSSGALYLLTMNHDNPDAFHQLKTMAARTVTVTGAVLERSGMKGLDVTAVQTPPAAAGR